MIEEVLDGQLVADPEPNAVEDTVLDAVTEDPEDDIHDVVLEIDVGGEDD